MGIVDVLDESHVRVLQTVDDLSEADWDIPEVCGEWSVKDILAHLTSHELMLIDTLKNILNREPPTPYLLSFARSIDDFNKTGIEARRYHTAQQVVDEYQDAQIQTTSLMSQVSEELAQRPGTLSWLNPDRTLAQMVEQLHAHTNRHCDQIEQFRKRENK